MVSDGCSSRTIWRDASTCPQDGRPVAVLFPSQNTDDNPCTVRRLGPSFWMNAVGNRFDGRFDGYPDRWRELTDEEWNELVSLFPADVPPRELFVPATSTVAEPHTFNFQSGDRDEFLHWMIPALLVGIPGLTTTGDRTPLFDALRDATSNWTDIRLTIHINGIEVPVTNRFMNSAERNLRYHTQALARALLDEVPEFERLRADLELVQDSVRRRLRVMVRNAGVDLDDEEGA